MANHSKEWDAKLRAFCESRWQPVTERKSDMKKVVFFILTIASLLILSGTTTFAVSTIDINTENSAEGYISVKFNTGSDKKIKLLVQGGDTRYYYNLSNDEDYVNFPLQMGNGDYTVAIYENTSGTKYRGLTSESFEVEIEDETSVFLNSIQEINYNEENGAALLAQTLVEEATSEKRLSSGDALAELTADELIELCYTYVVQNIQYDYEKINGLSYNYIPDNVSTLETGSGICYDFSSLLASMLRSQGVPTKLVKGYTTWTSVYHAWNEIYVASEDRWVVVDTTYDSYLYLRDRDYSFEKSAEVYKMTKEF